MAEWYINDEIRYLHNVISGAMAGSVCTNPVSDRLFHLGIISLFHQINDDLEKLSKDLDVSVILEGVSIDFDTYLDDNYWNDNFLFKDESKFYKVSAGCDITDISCRFQINQLTDYLPNGEEGYIITQDLIDTFKRSLNQLCDRNKLGSKEVLFALYFGYVYMIKQLKEIKEKVEHPKPHQFNKAWNELRDDIDPERYLKDYYDWKEKNIGYTFSDLKNQQTYRIFKLLNTDFFRFFDSITGLDVKNRKLIITDDNLPYGTIISDSIPAECAKFEKFFEWKGKDILSLDYEKLGQYIYGNYKKFDYVDIEQIIEFDVVMDAIHEDMAEIRPQLKQYLKGYEEEKINYLLKECAEILNTCQKYLAKDISEKFLFEYLKKLLFDRDMKEEARSKLKGQSRYTYLCKIVAALKNFRVFRIDCDKHDLAKSLSEKITSIQLGTITKNIERAYNKREGALYDWTEKNIEALLKEINNPLAGII